MANDGQIVFEVSLDGKTAKADLKDITNAIQKETKNWDDSGKKSADNISGSFTSMAKKIAATISAAKIGQMLLNIGKDAIEAASNLEEVQNVVDTTFGDAGSLKIEKWAKNAGKQFGLTETQAKQFTSTLGAMMKSAGLAGDQIVDMSTDMAGLAADMASFYNLDFDTAFQKIRAGLSGETEPLKQLGINLSVANLNAYALAEGIGKTYEQMDQGEQTMLRYQYIMKATADAQGDFSKTSDGFANASRKMETEIETLKTKLGSVLIPVAASIVGEINKILESLTSEGKRTVLDDFADIDLKTEQKIKEIESTKAEANVLVDVLDSIGQKAIDDKSKIGEMGDAKPKTENLDDLTTTLEGIESSAEGTKGTIEGVLDNVPDATKNHGIASIQTVLEDLGLKARNDNTDIRSLTDGAPDGSALDGVESALGDVETAAGTAQEAIGGIANPTAETAENSALWLETCKQLVETIPGLSEIINTQTGEVKGGTQAIRDYVDAWEKGQKKIALLGALEQKESALDSAKAGLAAYELEAAKDYHKLQKQYDELKNLYEIWGVGKDTSIATKFEYGQYSFLTNDMVDRLNMLADAYMKQKDASDRSAYAFKQEQEAIAEADIALEEYREAIEAEYGALEESTNVTKEWSETQKESVQTAVNAFQEALQAVEDYYNAVRESAAADVNKTLNGFNYVKSGDETLFENNKEAAEKYAKTYEDLQKLLGTEVHIKIDTENANKQINDMLAGMKSQIAFIEQYQKDLQTAREKGLSDDIASMLADGSEASAAYLAAIADADAEQIAEINATWETLTEKKEAFTDTLTEQRLAADKEYDALVEKAKQAAQDLDLSVEMGENTGKSIQAITDAIKKQIPDITQQVDAILAQLERLNGIDAKVNAAKSSVASGVTKPSQKSYLSYDVGTDYVPYTGLFNLHEGEAVLTREENRLWQAFKNNQNSIDYDTLGGVMRENVRAGGNVYLDGRAVGQVVSQAQGNQYRTLQRSGWQQ